MENVRAPFLSSLFPWLAPLVIKFELVDGGVEVRLYKNQKLHQNWHPSLLQRVLPLELTKWIEDHHIHQCLQPYPVVKQLWYYLTPHASKKLVIDGAALANLEEISQAQQCALVWEINRASERIEGRFEGADRYLGLGWLQKGNTIWHLPGQLSTLVDSQLRNLILPLQQANHLLKMIILEMRQSLPTRADFQLIADFAAQVIVADARSGGLILKLQSNYPQLLTTLQIPQQATDVLLAEKSIIVFSQQVRTPALMQLLQSRSSIVVQGANVPQFIHEQLPILRQHRQISDEMATKITQANPIVSIAALKPILTLAHRYENGIGKYSTTVTYQYQQHTLDMSALLAARQQYQRFVQQHAIWFEWPHDSRDLVNTILQHQATHVLRPEEVMGFDTRRTALLAKPMAIPAIQPDGTTPFVRGKSLYEQLRQRGAPGGIYGEPKGFRAMFVDACEHVVRDNRQARILWLVPSSKKGSVTSSLKTSTINQYVIVASLVTLRDEPALCSHLWTLIIFQDLDQLLDGSPQSWTLPRLQRQWSLVSITSKYALRPSIMQVLQLPEQYYEPFQDRFLFDLQSNYTSVSPIKNSTVADTPQSATLTPLKKEEAPRSIGAPSSASASQMPHVTVQSNAEAKLVFQTSIQQRLDEQKTWVQERLEGRHGQIARHIEEFKIADRLRAEEQQAAIQRRIEEQKACEELVQPDLETQKKSAQSPVSSGTHMFTGITGQSNPASTQKPVQPDIRSFSDTTRPTPASTPVRHAIELNQQKIVKLYEESELLQERLTVEDEEQEQLPFISDIGAIFTTSTAFTGQQPPQTPMQIRERDRVEKIVVQTSDKRRVEETFAQTKKPIPVSLQAPAKAVPERVKPTPAPTFQAAVKLDAAAISKLQAESEYLQERLRVETAEHERIFVDSMPVPSPDPALVVPGGSATLENLPEVDEDWQGILRGWKTAHWEIIVALSQGRANQVAVVASRMQRPISRLIDEINDPVAEQLDDVLIDPETLTIPEYFHEVAEKLTDWYLSSRVS